MPAKAIIPPKIMAEITWFFRTLTLRRPARTGITKAPEKKVSEISSDCIIDVTNSAMIILIIPMINIMILVRVTDLLLSESLQTSSLSISEEFIRVVSAEDITADSRAARNSP